MCGFATRRAARATRGHFVVRAADIAAGVVSVFANVDTFTRHAVSVGMVARRAQILAVVGQSIAIVVQSVAAFGLRSIGRAPRTGGADYTVCVEWVAFPHADRTDPARIAHAVESEIFVDLVVAVVILTVAQLLTAVL